MDDLILTEHQIDDLYGKVELAHTGAEEAFPFRDTSVAELNDIINAEEAKMAEQFLKARRIVSDFVEALQTPAA